MHKLIAGAVLAAASAVAVAQAKYPQRTVEVVVPYAPGGGTDNLMRMITGIIDENKWSPVPLNVNNRAGGSGAVGFSYLINKKGDPHVIAGATPMIVSGKIEGRLPGDHRDAMTILMIVAIDELMLSVRSESPYKTIDDFVKAARAKPNGLTVGGTATLTEDHIFTYLFEQAAKIQVKYVPFNSGGEVTTCADGRPHRRRRDEPERDRGAGRSEESAESGGCSKEKIGRCARPAHLRRARLRVLLGADARRGRAGQHGARGGEVLAGHAEEGHADEEVAGGLHQAQPPYADRLDRRPGEQVPRRPARQVRQGAARAEGSAKVDVGA
jgi:hypothetical protein